MSTGHSTPTWHPGHSELQRYATGMVDMARASSAEAHLIACETCRRTVSEFVDPGDVERNWMEIVDAVDAPRLRLGERVMRALGVRPHVSRLLVATPSLQASWLVAVTLALAFGVAAAHAGDQSPTLFLVLAPLLPSAGVALAFGPGVDPSYETVSATPAAGLRLLMIRAAAVFVTTVVLTAAAASILPEPGWRAAAWLLPALALSVTALALSTACSPEWSVLAVTAGWLSVVGIATLRRDTEAVFGAPAQAILLILGVLAAAVLVRRRQAIAIRSRI